MHSAFRGRELGSSWTHLHLISSLLARPAFCAPSDAPLPGTSIPSLGGPLPLACSPLRPASWPLQPVISLRSDPSDRLRPRSIRENIIGPTFAFVLRRCAVRRFFRFAVNRPFSPLHQPARQHRRRILLQPLVQQRCDFLPQIRRMSQPGHLETLQARSRRRLQEFPWRLAPVSRHVTLPVDFLLSDANPTAKSSSINSNSGGNTLWKSCVPVEISSRLCSACAGDYEDPDASAWLPDPPDREDAVPDGASPSSPAPPTIPGPRKEA